MDRKMTDPTDEVRNGTPWQGADGLDQIRLTFSKLEATGDSLNECRRRPGDSLERRVAKGSRLMSQLYAAGLSGRGWPQEYGGRGGDARSRAALYDTLTAAGFDLPEQVAALEVLGPALIAYAPALAARHLPKILAGGAIWCQGFSEPEAGSDLAALRTVARRVTGGWAISGQKIWTSLGHQADWCAVFARTGDRQSRHRGLTLFWVEMRSKGLTVRPLRAITGEEEFSEIFLEDVFVSDQDLIGDVDSGWAVAMRMFQYERGMWAWQRQARMHAALKSLVLDYVPDARAAQVIGETYLSIAAVRLRSRRTISRLANGEDLGAQTSVDKVLLSMAEQSVQDAVRQLRLGWFTFGREPASTDARAEWFFSRAASVYGGAIEIQRNLIAESVLGLPREPSRG
jgi:acyl-CoA dehydrogenase